MITPENEIARFFAKLGLKLKINKPNRMHKGIKHPLRHRLECMPGQICLDRFIPLLSYYFEDIYQGGFDYVFVQLDTFSAEGHGVTGVCKLCGCTEYNACTHQPTPTGTCYWVTEDMCSACVSDVEKAKYTALEVIERAKAFKDFINGLKEDGLKIL